MRFLCKNRNLKIPPAWLKSHSGRKEDGSSMDAQRRKELERTAMQIRITGLKMVQNAHSGHIGGAFCL